MTPEKNPTAGLFNMPTPTHPHFNQPLMAKLCKRRGGDSGPSTNTKQPNGVIHTRSGTIYAPYSSGWRKLMAAPTGEVANG